MNSAPALARTGTLGARLGLAAICLGFGMITLDATIVNVALRPIISDLGGSLSSAQWIVNGYTLAFAALLLTAGALSDRVGARAGYLLGLGVFALGSAVCSAANSMEMLVAARVVQGFGAAWLMPCSLALIAHTFPDPRERGRALAIWGGVSGIGLASGPILGGVLTEAIDWRAIFVVNVPVAVITAWLLGRRVAETRRHRHRLDGIGQVLAITTLATLTGGFILAGQDGWLADAPLLLFGVGAASAVAFGVSQSRVRHPMVDPVLFRRRTFAVAIAIGVIFNFGLYGTLFCLALDLQDSHHLGSFTTGAAMLPMTVIVGMFAFLAARVVARVGEWRAITAGLLCAATGALLIAVLPAHAPVWALVLCTLPIGLTSLAMPAMTAAALAGAPADRVGLASGVLNTARQTGGAFGVAVLGALLNVTGAFSLHVAFTAILVTYLLGVTLSIIGSRVSRIHADDRSLAGQR
ncbi:DHA2 family efflux MFS transporter permease subunit [Nocardia miyunensis]|uniref:DHA2 family efflux MFS transporter permease subunit n=1 Tax=Nocardia miyunensis TaxID=282684 RepID=UPI0008366B7E|nr:DHA2 family efflux MFS transporter permease subunit [Nocardia miyunensis]